MQWLVDWWHRLIEETTWLAVIGLAGQILFMSRMLVQWWATEKAHKSTVPVSFWILSIVGSSLVLIYGFLEADIVIILGQAFGFIVYFRNLYFIRKRYKERKLKMRSLRKRRKDQARAREESTAALVINSAPADQPPAATPVSGSNAEPVSAQS